MRKKVGGECRYQGHKIIQIYTSQHGQTDRQQAPARQACVSPLVAISVLTTAAPSKHSRAVRRATSPSINTDKSLKAAQPPPKPLGIHHGAGVSKRKAKQKPLSHAQRQRREKGMARAEAVLDQMERKVDRSRKKEKVMRGRSVSARALAMRAES